MRTIKLLCLATVLLMELTCQASIKLGVATVDGSQFCVGYRPEAWSANTFEIEPNSHVRVANCEETTADSSQYSATIVESFCNVSSLSTKFLFVKAPFSNELIESFNSSNHLSGIMQVRGDMTTALSRNKTVVLQPLQLKRIYWGSVIMYFFSLVYVTMSAVLVEVGRKIVKKHAHISPLVRIPCTQSRPFLVIFLVLFSVIIVVAFTGYIIKPTLFQPVFAVFLFSLAVVGFYHVMFPMVVYLAARYCRVDHKTYWMIERTAVILVGMTIFGIWIKYRLSLGIWPIHLALMTCVGVVPLRYAPVDCIAKMVTLGVISVLFSLVQRFVMPQITGSPPTFVDIVAVKASIPGSVSPGPIFLPDIIEPNMLHFRIPMFGDQSPCSTVIDGSFGMMNFLLPSIFIKSAIQVDIRTNSKAVIMKNYTVAVLAYLCCHTLAFIWSFVEESPVNSNLLYLPGIMLAVVLNSYRMGYLSTAFLPPSQADNPPQPTPGSESPSRTVVVYEANDSEIESERSR